MVPVVWAIADVNATIAIRLAIAVTRKLSAMAAPRITPATSGGDQASLPSRN